MKVFKQKETNNLRQRLVDMYGDDLLFADGYDSAIIGVAAGFDSPRVAYDAEKMSNILVKDDEMTYEEAWEWLEFNTFGAYVGESTPIYIRGLE